MKFRWIRISIEQDSLVKLFVTHLGVEVIVNEYFQSIDFA